MRLATIFLAFAAMLSAAHAQFVWPKPEYNRPEPGLYTEDPFIIEWRAKFFAVFRGDFVTFNKAYADIREMVRKNPKDARAMVWLGNGHTVQAGVLRGQGKAEEAEKLLVESRKVLDKAVALSPEDPNIYMMRAATLYIQGQYWPAEKLPRTVWETLRDDCLRFIKFLGDRMPRTSIHLRGETYGSLGIAYARLGEKAKAKEAFEMVIRLNPNTAYETRARREIRLLEEAG
jgi:tetratricopeptide (TPR) repeat protein